MSLRQTLSRAKRNRDAAQGWVRRADEVLRALDDNTLSELLRRAEHVIADGYPPNVGQSDIHGGRLSTPTEGSALRLAAKPSDCGECGGTGWWIGAPSEVHCPECEGKGKVDKDTWEERERDVVGEAVVELVHTLEELPHLLMEVDRKLTDIDRCRTFVFSIQAKVEGRVNQVELCTECNEPAPKVKRLDGKPYHLGACWWKGYRRTRRPA